MLCCCQDKTFVRGKEETGIISHEGSLCLEEDSALFEKDIQRQPNCCHTYSFLVNDSLLRLCHSFFLSCFVLMSKTLSDRNASSYFLLSLFLLFCRFVKQRKKRHREKKMGPEKTRCRYTLHTDVHTSLLSFLE
jgi:hypothetical protein